MHVGFLINIKELQDKGYRLYRSSELPEGLEPTEAFAYLYNNEGDIKPVSRDTGVVEDVSLESEDTIDAPVPGV